MDAIHLDTIAEYNEKFGFEGVNPHINVVPQAHCKQR